jgi:hypothetical protein
MIFGSLGIFSLPAQQKCRHNIVVNRVSAAQGNGCHQENVKHSQKEQTPLNESAATTMTTATKMAHHRSMITRPTRKI